MIQHTTLCFSMGSVHIHLNDSGYLSNAMATPKKKRMDVCGINTLETVLTCVNFSRSSKPFNHIASFLRFLLYSVLYSIVSVVFNLVYWELINININFYNFRTTGLAFRSSCKIM